MNITEKLIKSHLVSGEMIPGKEIAIKIDQTLTQDSTGTMAYLQFEAIGIPRVKTEKSVAYIDHNTLQTGFENADDHKYIQTVAKKHGIYFSKPGNGICHQVHLERFGKPGKTLLGSDSHTPTGGGIGMLAIGAGGLDVAVAMGGGAYYLAMPRVCRVVLTGKLSPWVTAKDVILEVLRRLSVKGGVGKVMEYAGEGVKTLSVPQRATITNMGAELGARILECGCGPCIGMGQAPATNAVSLRTINRNFEGRSGTKSAQVYIVSPETAVASALSGKLTDPHTLGEAPVISMPEEFMVNDNLIIPPAPEGECVKVVRGPNIQPFPKNTKVPKEIKGGALIKVDDNITTDHIMPSNAKLLPFRSNVPYLADYCLTPCDPEFPARAKKASGGFIIAGQNYGQGSSREHAALAPLQLGVKAVIAKSFARIHMANLINNGILPLVFVNEWDYDNIKIGDEFVIKYAADQIKGAAQGQIVNVTCVKTGEEIPTRLNISERQRDILLAGGLLNYTKESN